MVAIKCPYSIMKKIFLTIILISTFLSHASLAQNNAVAGWLFLSHIQNISPKINFNFDVQLRSKDNFDGLRNILIRPGISYNLNKKWSIGSGYTYIATETDKFSPLKSTLSENMVWEQIFLMSKINKLVLLSRVRLEQRFIGQQELDIFSERLRIFDKLMIPLSESKQLNEGIYLAVQDEILFNIQNKKDLNNHFFDQNRALLALGHYFNKNISSELGYQMNVVKGKTETINRHILQITLLSKFGS